MHIAPRLGAAPTAGSALAALDAATRSMQTQRNGTGRRGKPWRLLRVMHLAASSFDLGRALRRRSLVSGLRFALRLWLRGVRLGLRVTDRLGQHLKQLSLGLP